MSETPPVQEPVLSGRGRMARRLLPSLVLLGLLAAVLLHHLLNQQRPGGAEEQSFTVAGQEAVEADVAHRVVVFEGRLLADGAPWSSTSARGSVLVVNSWASWCGPCRAEQPSLTAVARAYRTKGVQVIGVNIRDNKAAARAYVGEFQVPYPSLFDPASTTASKLGAFALPTTFILDRDGVVAYRLTGKTTVAILTARLDKLLAQGGRWAR